MTFNDSEIHTIRRALQFYARQGLQHDYSMKLLSKEEIAELVHTLGPCGGYAFGEHAADCDCESKP